MADELFTPYVERLLLCLCAQMEALPEAQRPARCCVKFSGQLPTMGISVNEDECKCATAWVRIPSGGWFITSDDTFPSPDTSPEEHLCPRAWGLTLEMGIGRCPPTGNQTTLPTCDEQNAFAQVMRDDAAAFRKAIQCCFTVDPNEKFVIGDTSVVGPLGMCIQQTLTLTVMVVACNEC